MGNLQQQALQFEAMRRFGSEITLAIGLLLLLTTFGVAQTTPKDAPPDVPDAIQVPAGEEVVLYTHATGSQIYTCTASADGKFGWMLKAPDAELHDRKDKIIGHHSAGPSWKLTDGSEVIGKAAAHVSALDPDSISWLLVKVVSHSGNGLLSSVNMIQRVHTKGGQPPDEGCDASHRDAETKSNYTADYYFYAPAK
jgi:Protein of unknown function (DUF3455)